MAPLTAAEKQKLLLEQEIAKLSGAISRHSTSSVAPSYHPYRGKPSIRGSLVRGRGRGRGRGGSYALDLRQTNKAASSSEAVSRTTTPTTTIGDVTPEDGEVAPEPTPEVSGVNAAAGPSGTGPGWVKGKGKMGNMSLMTVEKRDQLRTQHQRLPKVAPHIQVLNSLATASGDKRVVIDGIMFQFEQDGKKLTRLGEAPSAGPGVLTPTRKSLSFGGGRYRRTSKGNLILKKRGSTMKSQQLCRYFTKTGRCNFGLTCPHIHDPTKVTICPRFLRGTCTLGASCPLSHNPSPHNTPSCLRFQTTSTCNVPNCPYPHIRVSPDAPVCEAFARGGWCHKEAGTCEELHVWECPEFRANGTCPKGGKCGLRHVVRAEHGRQGVSSKDDEGPGLIVDTVGSGNFEEQDEFITFDQGSPGAVSSGEESEGSDEEAEEATDSEDDDGDDDNEEDEDGDSETEDAQLAVDVDMAGTEALDLSSGSVDVAGGEYALPSAPGDHAASDPMDTDDADEQAVLSVVL
ncbi:hypothetical protein IAU60_006629 [Kwoniella sp. DSM 27419]